MSKVVCLYGDPGPVEDLPIDSLPATPSNAAEQYPHGRDHEAKFNSLRAAPSSEWPAICVVQYPDGRYMLHDGFHRLIVARERGEHTIRAHVHVAA